MKARERKVSIQQEERRVMGAVGRLRLNGPLGQSHELSISAQFIDAALELKVVYLAGDLSCIGQGVVGWRSTYEEPNQFDPGHLDIGEGRRDILIEELRGIGLGSLLMSLVVDWAKKLPDVPVATIELAGEDAGSSDLQARRNRFWEKLGFVFDYEDGGKRGRSRPMRSHSLLNPGDQMTNGWEAAWLDSDGERELDSA